MIKAIHSASAVIALALLASLPTPAAAQSRIEIGVLNCNVAGGTGFVFGSSKALSCVLNRPGRDERYTGTISKFGIDIGKTTASAISWAVFAPTADLPNGALDGDYAGVSGEATIGAGVGANALVGGSKKSISLQPLSVQAQQGLNIAAGIASMQLKAVK